MPDKNDQFRERLRKIISKKVETTMIYPLGEFEMAFGHLWGQGKDILTDEEKMFRQKWDQCRHNILNNGNRQIRNVGAELAMYDVVWNRYQTVFIPRKKNEEGI